VLAGLAIGLALSGRAAMFAAGGDVADVPPVQGGDFSSISAEGWHGQGKSDCSPHEWQQATT